ncbi:MAG: transposase, partial [Planctomycetes bacterium]|nr:transposase [Planctomycetota bacterium]
MAPHNRVHVDPEGGGVVGNGKGPKGRRAGPVWPPEVKLEIVRAHLEGGATVPELAKAYDAFKSSIYGWIARYRQV